MFVVCLCVCLFVSWFVCLFVFCLFSCLVVCLFTRHIKSLQHKAYVSQSRPTLRNIRHKDKVVIIDIYISSCFTGSCFPMFHGVK